MTRPDILTIGGTYFNFLQPEQSHIEIEVIAHALANIPRFGGHTHTFYSVAQHCVLASYITPPEDKFAALMHDAAEAYLLDIPAPLKQLLPEYKVIEKRVEAVIFEHFGLPPELPASVKEADRVLLATEQRDLMPKHDDEWPLIAGVEPLRHRIDAWPHTNARELFLFRFMQLTGFQVNLDPILPETHP